MDLLAETVRSLRAHALRYALTSLGIVWGAFMLTYLSATMEGTDRHFVRALQKAGPKIVFMGSGSVLKSRVGERGARPVKLEEEDVLRVASLADVASASPQLDLWSEMVRVGRRTKLMHLEGVNEHAASIRNFQAEQGRFLSRLDVARAARVAFLGAGAARRLFDDGPAVGRRIQIAGASYRVVGVAREKGAQLIDSINPDDDRVLIPWTTAQRWITHDDRIEEIVYEPVSREASWGTERLVRELIAPHHDFSPDVDTALWFFNIQEALSMVGELLLALRVFLLVAGVTTLLVGAVGVMNIMLVVVGERTAEIGLRKAVGARSRDVFAQFLAEAAAVCVISGLAGAAAGAAVSQLVARLLPPDTPFSSVPVADPVTAISIAASLVAVGIVAGIAPAIRAARIPPAEALRAS